MRKKQKPQRIDVWVKIEGYHQEIMAKLDEMLKLAKIIRREEQRLNLIYSGGQHGK